MESEHLLILLFILPFGAGFYKQLKFKNMREFLNIMLKDFQMEGFTMKEVMIYGIGANLVLVIGCVIGEWIAR